MYPIQKLRSLIILLWYQLCFGAHYLQWVTDSLTSLVSKNSYLPKQNSAPVADPLSLKYLPNLPLRWTSTKIYIKHQNTSARWDCFCMYLWMSVLQYFRIPFHTWLVMVYILPHTLIISIDCKFVSAVIILTFLLNSVCNLLLGDGISWLYFSLLSFSA